MMTRPPVSMWPTEEQAYKGNAHISCVIYPKSQKRVFNTAAALGAKVIFLYHEQAVTLYDEAQRTVSGRVILDHSAAPPCKECCRNCVFYHAYYSRAEGNQFVELSNGRCCLKRSPGRSVKGEGVCADYQKR